VSLAGEGTLVLHYHRIANLDRDPYRLCVRPETFAAQIERLRARARIVSLAHVLKRETGTRIAITLDDGYHDTAGAAREVLEDLDVPATVFVVAGAVGSEREFWWDRLERVVFEGLARSERLETEVAGARLLVDTRTDAGLARAQRALYVRLRGQPHDAIERSLAELESALGVPRRARATHRPLNVDELREVAGSPVLEVGAHTLSHPRLSSLPLDEQREEIGGSRKVLEELTGHTVDTFSYPHGDADRAVMAAVKEARYTLACVSDPIRVPRRAARFALPRRVVLDWPPDELDRRLDEWLAT
jgi:peptidoglycan/xylan/chitin deacetylase (PgdA/CDA1 family)